MTLIKQKLSIDEQIEHLKSKGVKFNLIDENEARDTLENHTYYFKIKSYSKNYKKDIKGKYIDLEFAYLVELSKIDMYLRRILINIALDIEHALKTSLLRNFNTTAEDGYLIVKSFLKSNDGKSANSYITNLLSNKNYSNPTILVKKYQNNLPIWVLVEILQLKDLWRLCKFFYGRHSSFYTTNQISFLENAIFSTRCLRNAAAHNSCIIKNIFEQNLPNVQKQCLNRLTPKRKAIETGKETIEEILKNRQISDFLMMCLLIKDSSLSNGLKNHARQEIENFFKNICFSKKRRKIFLNKQNTNRFLAYRALTVYKAFLAIMK